LKCLTFGCSCKDIDGESWVLSDLEVEWWQSEHIIYSIFIAIPSLIIWGFGVPLFAGILLSRHKNNLEDIAIREKYGFLFNGYKKRFYYWEVVSMYGKIAIIAIIVFMNNIGAITQSLIIFLFIIVFIVLNLTYKPYAYKILNVMEVLSLLTLMTTVYWGLFFLSHNPEVYKSNYSDIREADNGCKCVALISSTTEWQIQDVFPYRYCRGQRIFLVILDVQNVLRSQEHFEKQNG